ncbi:VanZ family protein [Flavobacterium sp. 14A]|uniref:VanZ family protein n=1 Tax=Flavobacterium sp. 14A TaxID=2735896 RepID=UPI00352E8028|nr:VanZ family protein [Flavobacterium sp. 14A]
MRKLFFLVSAVAWSAVILFLCLTKSSNIPSIDIPNLDKAVHAFFHFVFTSLWVLFFRTQVRNKNIYKPLFFSFVLSVFFGVFIEIAQQMFTTTRSPDMFDILANITGAALASFSILIFIKLRGTKQ